MVKAAYSSGKPAYGVGPGNVPVYVHSSARVAQAAQHIIGSKSFDWGTICASEQALVVDKKVKRVLKKELENCGAYFVDDYEKKRLEMIISNNGNLNPKIVGQSPAKLAEMAGIVIPEECQVLIAEETEIGKAYPFSMEKLSPILALYTADNAEEANTICEKILDFGGAGHTAGIHAEDTNVVQQFGLKQKAYRVAVNTGTTFGAIGATTNVQPSMTLGCGAPGNNITSDNIAPEHLLNIKRIAFGTKEIERQAPQQRPGATNKTIIHNYAEDSISKADIADIVKSVLQELKV